MIAVGMPSAVVTTTKFTKLFRTSLTDLMELAWLRKVIALERPGVDWSSEVRHRISA
jgi:hypothetical protein